MQYITVQYDKKTEIVEQLGKLFDMTISSKRNVLKRNNIEIALVPDYNGEATVVELDICMQWSEIQSKLRKVFESENIERIINLRDKFAELKLPGVVDIIRIKYSELD